MEKYKRDPTTKAIVYLDDFEYTRILERRQEKKIQKQILKDIAYLKKEINTIKEIISSEKVVALNV